VNVVDSSAWLEYLGDGRNAGDFAPAIEDTAQLAVPTLTLFEVFKRTYQLKGEATALEAVALMLQGRTIELSPSLAIEAAKLSLETGLAMADSIILATARAEDAVLWTQDAHFEGLERVEYRRKATTVD
jgi:predicted nucleic acid-binding protein